MEDTITFPLSLQKQIDNAQGLLAQCEKATLDGNVELAITKAELGLKVIHEISQKSAELGTLLIGSMAGHKGFTIEETQVVSDVVQYKQTFLGLDMGTKFRPITSHRTITREFKFI